MILKILKIIIKNKKKLKKLIIMDMNWMQESFWTKKIKMILINNLINHYFFNYKKWKINYSLYFIYFLLMLKMIFVLLKTKENNKL